MLIEALERPWEGLDGVVVVAGRGGARPPELRTSSAVARIQHGSGEAELVVGRSQHGGGDLVPWAPPGARVPVLRGTRSPYAGGPSIDSNGMLLARRASSRSVRTTAASRSSTTLASTPRGEISNVGWASDYEVALRTAEVEPNRPDFPSAFRWRCSAREAVAAAATGAWRLAPR